jgi:hypothetical protein
MEATSEDNLKQLIGEEKELGKTVGIDGNYVKSVEFLTERDLAMQDGWRYFSVIPSITEVPPHVIDTSSAIKDDGGRISPICVIGNLATASR